MDIRSVWLVLIGLAAGFAAPVIAELAGVSPWWGLPFAPVIGWSMGTAIARDQLMREMGY